MKAFVALFALVAAVSAEADPALLYGSLGYAGYALPHAYGAYAVGKSAPCVNANNVPVPCAAGHAYAPYIAHGIYKREAEAEADPALLYSGLAYGGYGLPYAGLYGKSAPCVNANNVPVPCAAGHAYAPYIAHGIYKREAEAEADPALLYSGLAYGSYGLPYAGLYGKSAPCVNAYNVPVPCAAGHAYAPYVAHGLYKREAEADSKADPAYFATALPYAGLPYAGLPYAGLPYAAAGLIHTSRVGVCLNYKNQQVPC